MVKKNGSSPVVKTGPLVHKLDSLDKKLGDVQVDIRRLLIERIDINERMRSMEHRLRQELRDLGSNLKNQLAVFFARMESKWRESIVLPKLLDEHGAMLRGHELRLKALEARQSP